MPDYLEGFSRPLVVADYLSARGIQVRFGTWMLRVCATVDTYMLDEMPANVTV